MVGHLVKWSAPSVFYIDVIRQRRMVVCEDAARARDREIDGIIVEYTVGNWVWDRMGFVRPNISDEMAYITAQKQECTILASRRTG
jgi:hypothetical protein